MYNTLTRPGGKNYFAYLLRDVDGALFNYTNLEFVIGQKLHLTLDTATRSQFRVPYVEIRPGTYRFEVDSQEFQDGKYRVETRELITNSVEGVLEERVFIDLLDGDQQDGSLNLRIKTLPGLSLFCFIKDRYSTRFYNGATQDFQHLDTFDEVEELRAPFRHSFTEVHSGDYVLNRSLANFPDGNYEILTYNLVDGIEYRAGAPVIIKVHDGRQQRGVLFNLVQVNHDTPTPDTMRYIRPNGEPVSGATVAIYLKSEFNSDNLTNPLGTSVTGEDGRWVTPIPIQAGDTYVVMFSKLGEMGPDYVDLAV